MTMTTPHRARADALLARHSAALEHSMNRSLIRSMADGSVSDDDFATYLAIEQRFVRTAARLTGYCIWQEEEWDVLVVHARTLAGLVGEQTEYFEARSTRPPVLPPGADALDRVVMDAVSEAGYPAVVTCLFAAETLYSRWCGNALAEHRGVVPGLAGEWIALHATDSFAAQVTFLHKLVDGIAPESLSDAAMDDWFTRMLAAEDAFHDSAITERPADA